MSQKVKTFLMFEGKAEEAMTFYISLFKDGAITSLVRYGAGAPGPEGSVMTATFTLGGQEIMCIDSPAKHAFTFTPAISLFVTCDTEAELRALFDSLGQDGKVYMPVDNYGFSKMFGWVGDRYGVTWQLNLP